VLERKIAGKSNAYQAFIDDCYVIGEQGALAMCVVVFSKFKTWCREHGQLDALRSAPTSRHLGKLLRKHVRGLEGLKLFRPGGTGPRYYVGIRLKTDADLDVEDELEVSVGQNEPKTEPEVVQIQRKVVQIRGRFLRRF